MSFREQKIVKNSRRLPVIDSITNIRDFHMSLFAKFQISSNWRAGEQHRYIYEEKVVISRWAKSLRISRPTLMNKLKLLKESNVIKEAEYVNMFTGCLAKAYKIANPIGNFLTFDVRYIEYLLSQLNDFELKLYILYYTYSSYEGGACMLDQLTILKKLGYTNAGTNYPMLTAANKKLANLGIIEITKFTDYEDGIKTKLRIIAPIYYETIVYINLKADEEIIFTCDPDKEYTEDEVKPAMQEPSFSSFISADDF